jgi:Microtubule-binding calmodulin-regulated spectrin-associated
LVYLTVRYNSGAKNFTEVTTTKHLSTTIDAVTIFTAYWQKKPAAKDVALKKLF